MYTEGFVRGAARQPRPVAGGAVYTVRVPRHRRGRQPVVLGGQRDALPVGEVAGEVQPEVILGGACGQDRNRPLSQFSLRDLSQACLGK